VLGRERQWIPLDPPFGEGATIGGIVAANDSGPRRHRYGSPRDLIIGIEVALASGRVARSGGRVVKNVAGYDLARLFCGSHGSLGLITRVTFKLAPLAPASRTVVARIASLRDAAALALKIAAAPPLTPSAIEVVAPDPRLLVRFESTPRSAEQMAAAAAAVLLGSSRDVNVLGDDQEAAVWLEHHRTESAASDGVVATIAVLPATSGEALEDAARVAEDHGIVWSATGRAALGVLRIQATGDVSSLRRFAAALRTAIDARAGHVRFQDPSGVLEDAVDPWGSPGSVARLGAAVKERFDPAGILPYPWTRP
jgi:glycolate oxidase FAD binding subunit